MRPVRAIVTGGAGFIGSHVVDALVARGDEVAVVDSLVHGTKENVNVGAELHVRDIREPLDDVFDAVRPQAVFHLAAQADVRVSVEHPVDDAEVNVVGTIRILEGARRHGAQVVFASTGGAIYGECEEPAPEDGTLEPLSPYGTSKLAAEEYLRSYNRLYGTRHIALRYGNVYGPRQDPHGEAGVVAIFFGALTRGEQAKIFGEGLQTRDYVYVGDVARATTSTVGAGSRRLQRRHRARDVRRRAVRALRPRRGLGHTRGARPGTPWRAAAELPRSDAGSPGARVHRHGRSRRRPARDLGVDPEGIAAARAKPSPVDHPLPAPDALIRPWRTAAYVAVAIAAVELLLLLVIGGGKLTGFVADRIQVAAEDQVVAPQTQRAAKPVTRKPASAAVAKRPRAKTVVLVLNGNGRTGAAASAASRVRAQGYKIGVVGNAPRQVSRSIVMYRPGFAGEGRRLGKDIGVRLVTPLDGMRGGQLGRAQVVFILGP